jgi:hypothetical protein
MLRIYDLCGSQWQVASDMTKYPVKTTIFYGKNSISFRRCNSGLFLLSVDIKSGRRGKDKSSDTFLDDFARSFETDIKRQPPYFFI